MLAPIFRKKILVSQQYGNQLMVNGKNVYEKFGFNGHEGVDFFCTMGTDLFAAIEGSITVVDDGKKGYGLSVRIVKTRSDGLTGIIYAHLSKSFVKTGDVVKVGDVIGCSGSSGNSTGPHLHFGVRFRTLDGKIINYDKNKGREDPMKYFLDGKYRKE